MLKKGWLKVGFHWLKMWAVHCVLSFLEKKMAKNTKCATLKTANKQNCLFYINA